MPAVATELPPTSEFRGNHWRMLKERGWTIGTQLQRCNGKRDNPRDTVKIVRIHALAGTRLDRDGNYDSPDSPLHGKPGWDVGGIITFCEHPIGGRVTAFSLNCDDWKEID